MPLLIGILSVTIDGAAGAVVGALVTTKGAKLAGSVNMLGSSTTIGFKEPGSVSSAQGGTGSGTGFGIRIVSISGVGDLGF